MRILIVTAGSHGDVHPFLGIGRAIQSLGHDAIVMTNPYFEPDVRGAGLEFRPHGEHIDLPSFIREHNLMHPVLGPLNVFRWLFKAAPGLIEEFDAAVTDLRPDAVLHHSICFGTRWICQKRGVAHAAAGLQPSIWFSAHDPVPAMQMEPGEGPARVARRLGRALGPIGGMFSAWPMNRLRVRCGFPKVPRALMSEFRGGDVALGLWSPEFRAPMPDDPAGSRITGFPFYDAAPMRACPPEVERFLDEGEARGDRPIVFALGTTAIHVAGEFYRHAAESCRLLGRRGLLLVGRSENVPARLPAGVIAAEYAPFSAVLPRAACSVVHGGIGSTAQALAAGRATLVAPVSHDQFNNGVRVERLGVGLTLGRRRLTVERLVQAIRACVEDAAIAARSAELGARLRGESGSSNAAEIVVGLAGNGTAGAGVTLGEGVGAAGGVEDAVGV
ncbi:MAG: glycosyltransferase family 1 protein [Phycisphaeraceae bacterium]|nr:glycosyltransferase family 1 protein [Phycisphaeraceae bacterium]